MVLLKLSLLYVLVMYCRVTYHPEMQCTYYYSCCRWTKTLRIASWVFCFGRPYRLQSRSCPGSHQKAQPVHSLPPLHVTVSRIRFFRCWTGGLSSSLAIVQRLPSVLCQVTFSIQAPEEPWRESMLQDRGHGFLSPKVIFTALMGSNVHHVGSGPL